MKRLLAILPLIIFIGCAGNIRDFTATYSEMSLEAKEFAYVSAEDWLFASGAMAAFVPAGELPSWVNEEIEKVNGWFESGEKLTDYHYGYILALRIRLAEPQVLAVLETYTPSILRILALVGL